MFYLYEKPSAAAPCNGWTKSTAKNNFQWDNKNDKMVTMVNVNKLQQCGLLFYNYAMELQCF